MTRKGLNSLTLKPSSAERMPIGSLFPFESIVERFVKKKLKAGIQKKVSTRLLKCNNCGDYFEFHSTGVRCGRGACKCGTTVIA